MQKVCLEVGLQERGSRKADEVEEEPGSDKISRRLCWEVTDIRRAERSDRGSHIGFQMSSTPFPFSISHPWIDGRLN